MTFTDRVEMTPSSLSMSRFVDLVFFNAVAMREDSLFTAETTQRQLAYTFGYSYDLTLTLFCLSR